MKNKLFKVIIPLAVWVSVWQISALIVSNNFLLPDISSTFVALQTLLCRSIFYETVMLSALRVLVGLVLGIGIGIILAIASDRFKALYLLLSPVISVIKATPVASFIVVLWVLMSGDMLSIFIGILMVLPLIWQSTIDALNSIDNDLLEVAYVFEFSAKRKFKLIIFPTIKRYLVPAMITSTGLAWKAEIAAEIIAYTKHSIGQGINDAKYNMDTPTVFAWTLVVITFSILLESLTKRLLRRTQ